MPPAAPSAVRAVRAGGAAILAAGAGESVGAPGPGPVAPGSGSSSGRVGLSPPGAASAQVSSRTRTSRPRVRLETCALADDNGTRPTGRPQDVQFPPVSRDFSAGFACRFRRFRRGGGGVGRGPTVGRLAR